MIIIMKIYKSIGIRNELYKENKEKFLRLYICMSRKFLLKFDEVERSLILQFNKRVWSWLRINAGGAHKTCKSNGSRCNDFDMDRELVRRKWRLTYNNGFSGGLVSNAWATCLLEGNNSEKSLLIPHMP